MKGKLVIEAVPGLGISVEMGLKDVSPGDVLALFDGIAISLSLDQEAREAIGVMLAAGGVAAIPGAEIIATRVSPVLWDLIRKKKKEGEAK